MKNTMIGKVPYLWYDNNTDVIEFSRTQSYIEWKLDHDTYGYLTLKYTESAWVFDTIRIE